MIRRTMSIGIVALAWLTHCSGAPQKTDGGTAGGTDGGDGGAVPCCVESVNPAAPLFPEPYLGSGTWMAWLHVPTCSGQVTRLKMPSNAPAIAILADNAGSPGSVLVPETPTTQLGPRELSATLPPTDLGIGKPVWIAIKHLAPGSIASGTVTPAASMGASVPKAHAQKDLAGPWDVRGTAAMVYSLGCM